MQDNENKDIKVLIKDFIIEYHKKLWLGSQRLTDPIALITLDDIRFYIGFHEMPYKEFKELIENDDDLNQEVQQFLTNNFIHYAASFKMKELLIDYKDSIVKIDPNQFKFNMDGVNSFVSNQMISKYAITLNTDPNTDVDEEDKAKILSTVETY